MDKRIGKDGGLVPRQTISGKPIIGAIMTRRYLRDGYYIVPDLNEEPNPFEIERLADELPRTPDKPILRKRRNDPLNDTPNTPDDDEPESDN